MTLPSGHKLSWSRTSVLALLGHCLCLNENELTMPKAGQTQASGVDVHHCLWVEQGALTQGV